MSKKAGIEYKLIPYEFDENDLAAQHVADSLGQDIARVLQKSTLRHWQVEIAPEKLIETTGGIVADVAS